jgi:hypothetical protein
MACHALVGVRNFVSIGFNNASGIDPMGLDPFATESQLGVRLILVPYIRITVPA